MENKKSVFYHLSFDQISIFSNTKKKCPWAFLFVYSNSFHFRKPIYRYSLCSRCFRPRFDRKSWNSKSWKIHRDRPFHIVCTDARAHRHAHKHARTCRYTHKHNVRRTCTHDKIKNHKFTYYQLSNYSLKTFMGVPKMLLQLIRRHLQSRLLLFKGKINGASSSVALWDKTQSFWEWAPRSAQAMRTVQDKRMSTQCERTSKWMSEWSSIYIPIFGCSEPRCLDLQSDCPISSSYFL